MKILLLFLAGILACVPAQATDLSALKPAYNAEYGYLEGSYTLVGKKEGSNDTYTGSLTLSMRGEVMVAERRIAGQNLVTGTATIKPLLENSRLLVITYPPGTVPQAVHYLMISDPDNYPLLAGYAVNEQGRAAETAPGLETLFYDHAATHADP